MNSVQASAGTVGDVAARIERLPISWWHVKTRIIVGVATFFDAFDAIAIATVLPVLAPMLKLTPARRYLPRLSPALSPSKQKAACSKKCPLRNWVCI